MGEQTEISWCDHTANLYWGCTEVHIGCDRCYARTFARAKGKAAAWDGVRFATKGVWKDLLKWQGAAKDAGEVRRVFCGSMMDIFEKPQPASDWGGTPLGITTGDLRDRFFGEIVPACPDLLFLLLTKRPGNAPKMVPASWLEDWPSNVMVGASVVNQETADTLIPQLLRVPGRLFLSMEPLLGPVDLTRLDNGGGEIYNALTAEVTTHWGHTFRASDTEPLHWIIVGGESGPQARPMHPAWAQSIRDQCVASGVAYHFKQWGEWVADGQAMPWLKDAIGARNAHVARALFPDGSHLPDLTGRGTNGDGAIVVRKVGKKAAGRSLDGRTWDQFPAVAEVANA